MLVADAFEDIEKDAAAHQAIALELVRRKYFGRAAAQCEKGLQVSGSETSSFRTMTTLAQIHAARGKGHLDQAYQTILEAFTYRPQQNNEELTTEVALLTREALVVRGDCERNLDMDDEAIASYEEARTICSSEVVSGEVLHKIALIYSFDENSELGRLIEKVEAWSFWERMAWLTYEPDVSGSLFQLAVYHAGKESLFFQTYEDMIACLDPLKASAWPRYQLAEGYRHLLNDNQTAKTVLYRILDSDTCIDPRTGEGDIEVLAEARLRLSEIIHEDFRSCSDPKRKAELHEEMKKLQESYQTGSPWDMDGDASNSAVILAMMTSKLGPMQEFQNILEKTFQACMVALTDTEGWNDSSFLRLLSRVLACVGGLEREASIACSAQFSIIDPDISHKPELDDEDDSDEEHEEDDGDKGEEDASAMTKER